MAAYYNEIDPFAAAWLRELIKAGLIADGEVDERSIELVQPDDLRGFVQCHFFAGIGGWSLALRLAGWADDSPVWTGSCPCQPFSSAGAQAGGNDSRDLWPVWFQLVKECRPVVVFGEQVEAAIGHGWLDRLCDDLEAEDYAVGAVGLPGPSVGAFDIRSRLWFVADSTSRNAEHAGLQRGWQHGLRAEDRCANGDARQGERAESRLADTEHAERGAVSLDREDERNRRHAGRPQAHGQPGACCAVRPLDDTEQQRAERSAGSEGRTEPQASAGRQDEGCRQLQTINAGFVDDVGHTERHGQQAIWIQELRGARRRHEGDEAKRPGCSFWADAEWIACRDGKARPVEPGTFPLVARIPGDMVPSGDPSASYAKATTEARVGRLRGYGNAIKPQVAAELISAYMDVTNAIR